MPPKLAQKFGAHLAYLLNTGETAGDPVVKIHGYALFIKLLSTLEKNDRLTGRRLLGSDITPQEAAQVYFDEVLKRPLYLARHEPFHKSHQLFLALCRRGMHDGWSAAKLVRQHHAATVVPAFRLPEDFASVADRLSQLRHQISDGNPARNTRAKSGPPYLSVEGALAEVAEEMTLWDAVSSAPLKLKVLAEGGLQYLEFFSLTIRAMEVANRYYGTMIALGLSPLVWKDVSLNTAKAVSAFLSAVRAADKSDGEPGAGFGVGTLEVWRAVWKQRSVPGFESAEHLWKSELGFALRQSQVPIMVKPNPMKNEEDPESKVLDAESFEDMLRQLRDGHSFAAYDLWLLRKLYAGATFKELAAAPETRLALGDGKVVSVDDLKDYMEKLQDRIHAIAAESSS